jgi:hypothetical protein
MIPSPDIDRAKDADILEVPRRYGGARLKRISTVEHAGACLVCGGRDRFSVNTSKGVFNCRGCGGKGDVIALIQFLDGCSFSEAVERLARNAKSGFAHSVAPSRAGDGEAQLKAWRAMRKAARYVSELRPLASVPIAKRYLRLERRIDIVEIWEDLQRVDAIGWHDAVYFSEPGHPLHGQKLGCIIGIMTDPVTAEPTGAISRTYLTADGRKVGPAKTLGAPRGVVRLSPDDTVEGGLFLCEGFETGLSAMAIGWRPLWACGDRGVMAKFPVLSDVEALNIVVDNDPNGAGEKAAREVEARWLEAGREVNLLRRDALGDLNDALKDEGA